jgi:hypothetical protein
VETAQKTSKPSLGNVPHNNGRIVGNGVFYAVCAEVIQGEPRQRVELDYV